MTRPSAVLRFAAASAILLALGACGESASHMNQAAVALSEHYASYPPASGWTVESIIQDDKNEKLVAVVLVTSDTDIQRIKILSRMEQFTIAKLACPTMTPALRGALGKTRVWVRLKTPKEELTSSICPQ